MQCIMQHGDISQITKYLSPALDLQLIYKCVENGLPDRSIFDKADKSLSDSARRKHIDFIQDHILY